MFEISLIVGRAFAEALENDRSFRVERRFRADVFDAIAPIFAELIITQAVQVRVDFLKERRFQLDQLRRVD